MSSFWCLLSSTLHGISSLRGETGPENFSSGSSSWGSLLYLPFFIGLTPFPALLFEAPLRLWLLSFSLGFIQTVYFICLIEAYRVGDLSIVYPISRSAPLYTLIWATLFIKEIPSARGVFGIGLVILGIFVISMRDFRSNRFSPQSQTTFSSFPYLLASISAVFGSVYSVLDKVAVQILHPIFYTWLINFWMSGYVGVYLLFHREVPFFKVWKESKKEMFTIALLQNIGYVCFLMALTMSKVSYVVAFRQVSALFGAGMGILILKERQWKTRMAGALILTLGLVLITLAK